MPVPCRGKVRGRQWSLSIEGCVSPTLILVWRLSDPPSSRQSIRKVRELLGEQSDRIVGVAGLL